MPLITRAIGAGADTETIDCDSFLEGDGTTDFDEIRFRMLSAYVVTDATFTTVEMRAHLQGSVDPLDDCTIQIVDGPTVAPFTAYFPCYTVPRTYDLLFITAGFANAGRLVVDFTVSNVQGC